MSLCIADTETIQALNKQFNAAYKNLRTSGTIKSQTAQVNQYLRSVQAIKSQVLQVQIQFWRQDQADESRRKQTNL
jgi:hypothetical protein